MVDRQKLQIFYRRFFDLLLIGTLSNLSHSGHLAGSLITIPVPQCAHVYLYLLILTLL